MILLLEEVHIEVLLYDYGYYFTILEAKAAFGNKLQNYKNRNAIMMPIKTEKEKWGDLFQERYKER